jgi:cellulose synthase/poly-beta-1,6-N-acetylglucosamine synthase-like glycosyltransferase
VSQSVSLIIPVRNSAANVAQLVEALRQLERPQELEIIIADNNSSDGTWESLWLLQRLGGLDFKLIRETDVASSYAARNAGIRSSSGSILAFTDADCRPRPDWLSRLVESFAREKVGIAAGEIEAAPATSWPERFAARRKMLSQVYTLSHPYRSYAQTANIAIRRSVLRDIGLFRPDMISGGDADLCWRAMAKDWHLEFNPAAVVVHRHRRSLRELWAQWVRYGTGHRCLCDLYGIPLPVALGRVQHVGHLYCRAFDLRGRTGSVHSVGDVPLALWCCLAFATGSLHCRTGCVKGDVPQLTGHPVLNDILREDGHLHVV